MKLHKIILWGVLGITIAFVLTRLVFKEPFVAEAWAEDLFTRLWFLVAGMIICWIFKSKEPRQ